MPASLHKSKSSSDDVAHRSRRRHRGIATAAVSALLSKGSFYAVSAITVSLTVRYLGAEGYGLWSTINSAVLMFFVLDVGIANTLTNLISQAYAEQDKQKASAYFATALWSTMGISILLGFVAWSCWSRIDWPFLFHIQDPILVRDSSRAVGLALLVFLIALPSGLATRVLSGYQELHISNFFSTGGSFLSLLLVAIVIRLHGSLPTLVVAYAGSPVIANAACLLWVSAIHKPWMKPYLTRIRRDMFRQIFHSGGQFFLIQIAGIVVFNSDNIVISHYLSPTQVTPYNVTWRLVSFITAAQGLSFSALWPAYAEAYARGDIEWIRKTYARNRWITVATLAAGCAILLPLGRTIIRIWAGTSAVPSMALLCLMCLWMIIFAVATNQSCLLGATSRIGKQAIAALLGAATNLVLTIVWVRSLGTLGVLLGTIVSYLLFICWSQALEVRKILRGDFVSDQMKECSSL